MAKVGGREEVRGTGDPPDWPGKSCAKQSDGVVWGAMICSPRGINCNPELAKLAKVQKGLRGQKFGESEGGGWKATKRVRARSSQPTLFSAGIWSLEFDFFLVYYVPRQLRRPRDKHLQHNLRGTHRRKQRYRAISKSI